MLLLRLVYRHISRRLLQSILFVVGVALGVAVGVAIGFSQPLRQSRFQLERRKPHRTYYPPDYRRSDGCGSRGLLACTG